MPGMADPNFSTTVTLICEHNADGALGIIINRPLTLKLSGLFEQLNVDDADPVAAGNPVFSGGPVGTERGFVLHGPAWSYENTLPVSDDIQLTLSRDVIDAIASGEGPDKSLVAPLGFRRPYAGYRYRANVAGCRPRLTCHIPGRFSLLILACDASAWQSARISPARRALSASLQIEMAASTTSAWAR